MCEPDKTGKIVLLFSFLCQSYIWKVPCDVFILRNNNTQNKRKNSFGLIARLPIGDR